MVSSVSIWMGKARSFEGIYTWQDRKSREGLKVPEVSSRWREWDVPSLCGGLEKSKDLERCRCFWFVHSVTENSGWVVPTLADDVTEFVAPRRLRPSILSAGWADCVAPGPWASENISICSGLIYSEAHRLWASLRPIIFKIVHCQRHLWAQNFACKIWSSTYVRAQTNAMNK